MATVQWLLFSAFVLMVLVFCVGIWKKQVGGSLHGVEIMVRMMVIYFITAGILETIRTLKQ